MVDQTTERIPTPSRGALAAVAFGFAAVFGGLLWWGGARVERGDVDCDAKFVVALPDSAQGVQCHGEEDRHWGQWRFTMPTSNVESWWAGQSETAVDLDAWLLTKGCDDTGCVSGVSVHYPEDEGGYLVVNPKASGKSEVFINGSWK